MRRRRPRWGIALGKAALIIAAWCGSGLCTTMQMARAQERTQDLAAETSSSVLVALAKQNCFSATISVTAFLLPAQEAIVTLELEGYQVTAVDAHEGDRVTSGQILAHLSRIGTSLRGQQEIPAEISLKAPASGRIEESTAILGSVAVPKGDPLFRIAVGDGIELRAEVPGLYLQKITAGQTTVKIQTPGGEILGQVKRIGAEVDKTTQLGHVQATLAVDPNNEFLRIGTFVPATLTAGQSCGVSVPRSAVYYGPDGTTVQIVHGQTVETRRVRVGLSDDQDVEIEEGVQGGEVVVAHAGSALRDGDHVVTTVAESSDITEQR
jgi:HlyD family secretion protein